jgi:4-amino-4-deoxy-L-arabinose transferase-like glycosyltransferase
MKAQGERRVASDRNLTRAASRLARFLAHHPSTIIVPLFILWGATHLDGFSWDYDEGTHTIESWLWQQGHPLYSQTFSAYTPGYLATLVLAYDVLGATMFAARLTTVLYAALGMGAVMLAAGLMSTVRTSGSPGTWRSDQLAAAAAAALLAVTPFFVQWSRAAMSDLPSEAVTALAVSLALIYWHDRRLRWLYVSVFVIAAALWIKATALGGAMAIAVAAALVLWQRKDDIPRAVTGSLLIAIACALPLLAFDVPALYRQAIYFHIEKRSAYPLSLETNLGVLLDFLSQNLTLAALAVYGSVQALLSPERRAQALVVACWFAATFASLLLQSPIFANHHPVILIFALAAAAGSGLWWLVADLRLARMGRWSLHQAVAAIALLLAVAGLTQYPDQLSAVAAPPLQPPADEAVVLLRALTSPADLLVSDAQVIAFRAQRQPPPALSDTATARIASGNLTAEQLVAITQASGANGILFWSGRLESAAGFADWAQKNYHVVRSSFQKPSSPYRLMLRAPRPQFPLDAQLGYGVRLLGYDLDRRADGEVVAGRVLSLTLYFQRTGVIDRSYTIFTHLLAPDGSLAAQEDRLPLAGRYPTEQWKVDEWIVDEFALPLVADLATADYQIEVGMYRPDTLERLPVSVAGVRQPGDRLLLPAVRIRAVR